MVIAGMVFGELPKLSRKEVLYFNTWVLRALFSMASSLSLFDRYTRRIVQDMPENTKAEKMVLLQPSPTCASLIGIWILWHSAWVKHAIF